MTDTDLSRLAWSISAVSMETIAMCKLGVGRVFLEDLRTQHRENSHAIKVDLFVHWRNKSGEGREVRVTAGFQNFGV